MGTFIQDRNGEKYFDHTASNEGFSGLFIGGLTNGKGAAIFVNSDDATIAFELVNSKMYFTSSTDFRNLELGGTKTFTFDTARTVTGYSNTINGRLRATGQKITTLDTLKPRPGQSGVLGRHLLETKNYDKAIGFLSKGLASEPSDSSLVKKMILNISAMRDLTIQ